MEILNKFKSFALKWNVIDLAVWVIIGTAFGKIVSSLVWDVVMPLLGALLNTVDFTKLAYPIPTLSWWVVMMNYGKFLQTLFDFMIIAIAIFVLVNLIDKASKKIKWKQEEEEKCVAAPADILLLTEIRDLLSEKSKKNTKTEVPTLSKKATKKK